MLRSTPSDGAIRCATIAELLHELGRIEVFEILRILAQGPARTGELAAALELDYSSISGKLNPLRAVGLVQYRRIKKFHVYSLADSVQVEILRNAVRLSISLSANQQLTILSPPLKRAYRNATEG